MPGFLGPFPSDNCDSAKAQSCWVWPRPLGVLKSPGRGRAGKVLLCLMKFPGQRGPRSGQLTWLSRPSSFHMDGDQRPLSRSWEEASLPLQRNPLPTYACFPLPPRQLSARPLLGGKELWDPPPCPTALPLRASQPLPCLCLQRCCTWLNSTWRRGSQTKKPSPSLTWRHQDSSGRTSGKRSRATVSWVPAGPVCVSAGHRPGGRGALGARWARRGEGGPLCALERPPRQQAWGQSQAGRRPRVQSCHRGREDRR